MKTTWIDYLALFLMLLLIIINNTFKNIYIPALNGFVLGFFICNILYIICNSIEIRKD